MPDKPHMEINDLGEHTLTINVRVTRRLQAKVWLATKLIQLAAWILGANSEINIDEEGAT